MLDHWIAVDDPDDPRLDIFQGLRDHVLRQRRELPDGDMAGVFISEGDVVVERALAAGYELVSILVDAKRRRPLPDAVPSAVPIFAAGPEVLIRITGYHLHRGALACFKRRQVPSVVQVLADHDPRTVVVLENINNPTNMGVILRCAAGLGVDAFFCDPTCSDPLYRRSGRVSMGEAYALPYARLDAFPAGLDELRDRGFTLLALTPGADSLALDELRFRTDDRVALLLGAEGPGLSDGVLHAVDQRVRIPMSGSVDSINVGSAAAVAFYGVQHARRSRA
jgi:tRNA G18 (ribose-2'-O)-methylase SpoU